MFESRLTQAGEELLRAQSRRVLNYAGPDTHVPTIRQVQLFLARHDLDGLLDPLIAAPVAGWICQSFSPLAA